MSWGRMGPPTFGREAAGLPPLPANNQWGSSPFQGVGGSSYGGETYQFSGTAVCVRQPGLGGSGGGVMFPGNNGGGFTSNSVNQAGWGSNGMGAFSGNGSGGGGFGSGQSTFGGFGAIGNAAVQPHQQLGFRPTFGASGQGTSSAAPAFGTGSGFGGSTGGFSFGPSQQSTGPFGGGGSFGRGKSGNMIGGVGHVGGTWGNQGFGGDNGLSGLTNGGGGLLGGGKRVPFSGSQLAFLEEFYRHQPNPDQNDLQTIADHFKVTVDKIKNWFSYRRRKSKWAPAPVDQVAESQ